MAVFNPFELVAVASNKLLTFDKLKSVGGINIPEYTTDINVAKEWLEDEKLVLSRTLLTSNSGHGIFVNSDSNNIRPAPLYVKYIPKKREYRVHVIFGEVVDVQQKKKRQGFDNANYQVRNHTNGWVYCRENIEEPTGLREIATRAVEALGLDFGAVDIVWNEKRNTCYVLEVNTAPGLEGTTVGKYATTIWRKLNEANTVRN